MAIRKVIKISVTPSAKRIIEEMAEKNLGSEMAIASRVYEWFALQDDVVRKSILGLLPEGYEVDVAKLALEKIASGRAKGKG